jgi:hypothetical protein
MNGPTITGKALLWHGGVQSLSMLLTIRQGGFDPPPFRGLENIAEPPGASWISAMGTMTW